MSTQRQIEANRRNAAKSTGPTSIEGKAVSSMNALQSGIHAKSAIITGEDSGALAQLAEAFYRDHKPQTAMERALLDNVIRDTWLLTRFSRIDAEIIHHQIADDLYPNKENQAGKAFIDSSLDQTRLQRRINDTRRSQIQAFNQFQRLQAERPAPPPAPQPQPPAHPTAHPTAQPLNVTCPPATPQEQIGFVPQASFQPRAAVLPRLALAA
jgi:hypothetical protein